MLSQIPPCHLQVREVVVEGVLRVVVLMDTLAEARRVAGLAAVTASPALRQWPATRPPILTFTCSRPMVVSQMISCCKLAYRSCLSLTFFLAPDQPFTPQRAEAANMVYGNIDPWREASELTPRTQNATRNLMSKSIDRLYALSKDLIGHLSIEGEERDESWIHELRFHKDVFTSFYSIYAQDADLFVDIDSVSETTKASEVPMLWERMIKGVSTANLARLLSDVEDLDGDPSNVLNRLPLLRKLDDNFPTVFTPGGPQGLEEHRHWVVDTATVDLAFAIRVQRFIETLRGVQEVSPIRHYATIFLNVDFTEFQDHEVEQFLDKAPLRDFAGFDINGPFTDTFRDALSSFRAMILERDEENVQADSNAIISKLEQEYAFDVFVRTLKDWVKAFDNKIPGLARPAYNGDSAFPADAQLQIDPASQQQQGR